MFESDGLVDELVATGIAVDPACCQAPWLAEVTETLGEARLPVPTTEVSVTGGREGIHTDALGFLLAELQFMQRAYPGLQW